MRDELLFLNLLDFDRRFYNFRRPEKDMTPYTIINKDEKTIIIHNVVGINKEDLKVVMKLENSNKMLDISGETKDEITGQMYSINSRFKVNQNTDVESIDSEMKNGLLYITIEYKKPVEKTIKVK